MSQSKYDLTNLSQKTDQLTFDFLEQIYCSYLRAPAPSEGADLEGIDRDNPDAGEGPPPPQHIPLAGYVGTPIATEMTEKEIAEAMETGQDPWAEDVQGMASKRNAAPPLELMIVVTRVCALLADQRAGQMLDPEAVTLFQMAEASERNLVAQHLITVLAGLTMVTRPLPWDRIKVHNIPKPDPSSRTAILTSKSQNDILEDDIRAGKRNVILASAATELPVLARMLIKNTFIVPALDQKMILALLRHTHSVTGRIADEAVTQRLPPDAFLASISVAAIGYAFAAETSLGVADRLRKLSEFKEQDVRSKDRATNQSRLSDMALSDEIRGHTDQILNDLKLWRSGKLDWSEVPSSLFLHGPPGNGKTMLPAALAGSAEIPLIATSYADCQRHGHLGDYLREMAKKVEQAISEAPSVFFLDEMDSFGVRHGKGNNSRYMTSVVNGLLEHLSRLNDAEGVLLIGAANHPEMIDPAILRAGRFDTHVEIGIPTQHGITQILEKQLQGSCDVPANFAERLLGHSGAEITALIRNARAKARKSGEPLTSNHLIAAADHLTPSPSDAHLTRVAIHEAGHVIAGFHLGQSLPKHVRILGRNGEYVPPGAPPETAEGLRKHLVMLLAGRAAEIAFYGYSSTGASDDLKQATAFAFSGQYSWGLGKDNLLAISPERLLLLDPNTQMGRTLNTQLQEAQQQAVRIINERRDEVTLVAKALIERRELIRADLADLLTPDDDLTGGFVEPRHVLFLEPKTT